MSILRKSERSDYHEKYVGIRSFWYGYMYNDKERKTHNKKSVDHSDFFGNVELECVRICGKATTKKGMDELRIGIWLKGERIHIRQMIEMHGKSSFA